ncbi:cytochrome c family protein [Sphingorhabdus sp. EL138]|uniref:c-type cytochrome n=1 Tax=Sphingorhabdus sp. EL138 TaxID=2073156 RepID=UPI000D686EFE|nr:cytochrome c family protein [Sphingorhabdus sp. EL138]
MSKILIPLLFGSALLVSCSQSGTSESDQQSAKKTESVEPASPAEPMNESNTPKANSKGMVAFLKCRSCHTINSGEPNLTGPNLHGLFDSKAGSKNGFAYSEALASSGIIWSPEKLDAWLSNPRTFLPGNKMAFAGVPNPDERKALIEYLAQETQ